MTPIEVWYTCTPFYYYIIRGVHSQRGAMGWVTRVGYLMTTLVYTQITSDRSLMGTHLVHGEIERNWPKCRNRMKYIYSWTYLKKLIYVQRILKCIEINWLMCKTLIYPHWITSGSFRVIQEFRYKYPTIATRWHQISNVCSLGSMSSVPVFFHFLFFILYILFLIIFFLLFTSSPMDIHFQCTTVTSLLACHYQQDIHWLGFMFIHSCTHSHYFIFTKFAFPPSVTQPIMLWQPSDKC